MTALAEPDLRRAAENPAPWASVAWSYDGRGRVLRLARPSGETFDEPLADCPEIVARFQHDGDGIELFELVFPPYRTFDDCLDFAISLELIEAAAERAIG